MTKNDKEDVVYFMKKRITNDNDDLFFKMIDAFSNDEDEEESTLEAVAANIIFRAKKAFAKATMDKDNVTITCYGKTEKMLRKDAISTYKEYEENSDGCERTRYTNILMGLYDGKSVVTDKDM